MKKNHMAPLCLLCSLLLFLQSCGDQQNKSNGKEVSVASLKEQKNKLLSQRDSISEVISELDELIMEKDTLKEYTLIGISKIEPSEFKHYIEILGNIETDQNVILSAEYGGTLQTVNCKKGDFVKKGQLLATIDDSGLENQLKQLETDMELTKTTFERQQRLWDQKIGSEIKYLQAKSNYVSATNRYEQTSDQLKRTVIRAPFSGYIDDIIVFPGSLLTVGKPVFRILNLNKMHISVDIPERYLKSVKKGTKALVKVDVLDEVIDTKIRFVGSYINPENRTFKVDIGIPNSKLKLKPNLTAKVSIYDYVNEKSILIPENLIQQDAGEQDYVYTANLIDPNNQVAVAQQRMIKKGKSQNGLTEVLEGLDIGDLLVTEGSKTLSANQKILINFSSE